MFCGRVAIQMKRCEATTIYLVRHAETTWNRDKIVQGQVDSAVNVITQAGLNQVEQFASKFASIDIDELYSADLAVAMESANIISRIRKLSVKTSSALRGLWWGVYEGKSLDFFREQNRDILEAYKNMDSKDAWEYRLPGNLESHRDMYNRVRAFIEMVAVLHGGKTVLVVCHSGIIRSILIKIGWAQQKELLPGSVENMGYIKLSTKPESEKLVLEEWNGIVKKQSIF